MKIPKGTIKAIFSDANQMYMQNFALWLKVSLPWLICAILVDFGYWNNERVINWLNQNFFAGFFMVDFLTTVIFFLMLSLSVIATILTFDILDRGEKMPSVFRLYVVAGRMLWPLIRLKIRFLFRVAWKLLLLVVPGVFAFTDGVAYYFAFLLDNRQGGDAIRYSESVVRVDRARYWDYLLAGILFPCLVAVPFMILLDQCAYVFRLKDLFYMNLTAEGLKYVALYFSVIYFLVFHSRVYLKFKSFLSAS